MNRIKKYRKERGLTQRKLADKLYISLSTMSSWEHGRHYPSIPDAVRLAETLGCSLDSLFRGGSYV